MNPDQTADPDKQTREQTQEKVTSQVYCIKLEGITHLSRDVTSNNVGF